jgi:hypothetical protein
MMAFRSWISARDCVSTAVRLKRAADDLPQAVTILKKTLPFQQILCAHGNLVSVAIGMPRMHREVSLE